MGRRDKCVAAGKCMNLPELLPLASSNDLNTPSHFHINRKLRSTVHVSSSQLTSCSDPFFVNVALQSITVRLWSSGKLQNKSRGYHKQENMRICFPSRWAHDWKFHSRDDLRGARRSGKKSQHGEAVSVETGVFPITDSADTLRKFPKGNSWLK